VWLADLNNEGGVTGEEVAGWGRAARARERGRLSVAVLRADGNADGVVTMEEMRAFADKAALKALSESAAAGLRNLLAMDLNENGVLTLDEVIRAMRLLADAV